jgi:2-polyprenyl-3-methyl-5-hydroxy-6-metoxy-1,4-benzoquinol methylase
VGGPDLDAQRAFWAQWNLTHRTGEVDVLMERQAGEAAIEAERLRARRPGVVLNILEVGCGTGWLVASLARFGDVTATDLSEASIEVGRERHPDVRFVVGDVADVDLGGPYDLVLSADVISHVADQKLFVTRLAEIMAPGGTFLLMTQNPFVWNRSTTLAPQGAGQLRNWPTLKAVRALLDPEFEIRRIGSVVPGGDRGVLRVANSRWLRGGFRKVGLGTQWRSMLERVRIGRELVIVATRR